MCPVLGHYPPTSAVATSAGRGPVTGLTSAVARPVVLGIVTVTGAYAAAGPAKHSRAAVSYASSTGALSSQPLL